MVALAPLTLTAAVAPRSALLYHMQNSSSRASPRRSRPRRRPRRGPRRGEGTEQMLTLLSRAMAARQGPRRGGAAHARRPRLLGVSGGGGDSLHYNMGNATALVKAAVDAASALAAAWRRAERGSPPAVGARGHIGRRGVLRGRPVRPRDARRMAGRRRRRRSLRGRDPTPRGSERGPPGSRQIRAMHLGVQVWVAQRVFGRSLTNW
jgi:hypothetical protein